MPHGDPRKMYPLGWPTVAPQKIKLLWNHCINHSLFNHGGMFMDLHWAQRFGDRLTKHHRGHALFWMGGILLLISGNSATVAAEVYNYGSTLPTTQATTANLTASYSNPNYLQRGDQGEVVLQLQRALREKKFLFESQELDGVFGENTEIALKNFQTNQQLTIDGKAGPSTFQALGLDSGVFPLTIAANPVSTGDRAENLRFHVVIPFEEGLLARVQKVIPDAFVGTARPGRYIQVGAFGRYEEAMSRSYALQAQDFDARVMYF